MNKIRNSLIILMLLVASIGVVSASPLTINVAGNGNGTVDVYKDEVKIGETSGGTSTYDFSNNNVFRFIATPGSGYVFKEYRGNNGYVRNTSNILGVINIGTSDRIYLCDVGGYCWQTSVLTATFDVIPVIPNENINSTILLIVASIIVVVIGVFLSEKKGKKRR